MPIMLKVITSGLWIINFGVVVAAVFIDSLRDYGFVQRFLLAAGGIGAVAWIVHARTNVIAYRLGYHDGSRDTHERFGRAA